MLPTVQSLADYTTYKFYARMRRNNRSYRPASVSSAHIQHRETVFLLAVAY